MSKGLLLIFLLLEEPSSSMYKRWFIKNMQAKRFEFLIDRQRWLRTNSHYLMNVSARKLYLRVISIYQISSYLTKDYWIKS
ncbi:hypothetical protein LINGRAHAP2_LOCUS8499 [Linum grandiflorum]